MNILELIDQHIYFSAFAEILLFMFSGYVVSAVGEYVTPSKREEDYDEHDDH